MPFSAKKCDYFALACLFHRNEPLNEMANFQDDRLVYAKRNLPSFLVEACNHDVHDYDLNFLLHISYCFIISAAY